MKRVHYEWDHEYTDENGDIVDHDFSHGDDFPGFPKDKNCSLVLVREYYDAECCFLEDKQWAYVVNGKLPEEFDGGTKVPARFHKMIEKETT